MLIFLPYSYSVPSSHRLFKNSSSGHWPGDDQIGTVCHESSNCMVLSCTSVQGRRAVLVHCSVVPVQDESEHSSYPESCGRGVQARFPFFQFNANILNACFVFMFISTYHGMSRGGDMKGLRWSVGRFGEEYARMLLIFSMTMMYSVSCPLITPFGNCLLTAWILPTLGRSTSEFCK